MSDIYVKLDEVIEEIRSSFDADSAVTAIKTLNTLTLLPANYTPMNCPMLFIKDCAESVGLEVTENTAFSLTFIAEIMWRMRKIMLETYS